MQYTTLDKKAKTVMRITALIQALFFTVPAIIILWKIPYIAIKDVSALSCVAGVLGLLWIVVVPAVRFKRYRYLIAQDRIEIIEGVFWIKRTVVPIDRVHQISVSKGPVDSAFGVAKVQVITAGSTAAMRFLNEEKANEIAMYLNGKVNEKLGGSDNVQ